MTISAKLLKDKHACPEQVRLFRKFFGDRSVTVSEALCLKHAKDFYWDWAAKNLLPAPAWEAYQQAKARAFARAATMKG